MNDKAYATLLAELRRASEWSTQGQTRKHFGLWYMGLLKAVGAAQEYLKAIGVPGDLLDGLSSAYLALLEGADTYRQRERSGPKLRPFGQRMALASAAAAVTALYANKACDIPGAIARVAGATGITGDEIRKFRDAIHRRTADPLAIAAYRISVTELTQAPQAEFRKHLRVAGRSYRASL